MWTIDFLDPVFLVLYFILLCLVLFVSGFLVYYWRLDRKRRRDADS